MIKKIAALFTLLCLLISCAKQKTTHLPRKFIQWQGVVQDTAIHSENQKLTFQERGKLLELRVADRDEVIHTFSYGNEYKKYLFRFHDGNVAGLLPVQNPLANDVDLRNLTCPCELFFCDTMGNYTCLEENIGWRYKIVYSNYDDAIWVVFCDSDFGKVFKISDSGVISNDMTFFPEIMVDSMRLVLKNGIPSKLFLDTIEMSAEYDINMKEKRITFLKKNVHEYNGYKP